MKKIILLVLLFVSSFICCAQDDATTKAPPKYINQSLQLTIESDKQVYTKGDTAIFTVVLKNLSNEDIPILELEFYNTSCALIVDSPSEILPEPVIETTYCVGGNDCPSPQTTVLPGGEEVVLQIDRLFWDWPSVPIGKYSFQAKYIGLFTEPIFSNIITIELIEKK